VLGGGGARGFAHISLVRALEELDPPVDVAGGTSMGAFVSALVACGFDSVQMAGIARETFVRNKYLNDYSLPRVSLIRGRKFVTHLDELFGELRIEDLRRTYFCVSANLTTGAVVHDRGKLAMPGRRHPRHEVEQRLPVLAHERRVGARAARPRARREVSSEATRAASSGPSTGPSLAINGAGSRSAIRARRR
jgi:hypothetical protein